MIFEFEPQNHNDESEDIYIAVTTKMNSLERTDGPFDLAPKSFGALLVAILQLAIIV